MILQGMCNKNFPPNHINHFDQKLAPPYQKNTPPPSPAVSRGRVHSLQLDTTDLASPRGTPFFFYIYIFFFHFLQVLSAAKRWI